MLVIQRYSFLSGSTFAPSIQLNPVLDHSKDVPDFSFGVLNPRPPTSSLIPLASESPRFTHFHKRYQRAASPLQNRISAPTVALQTAAEATTNETEESQAPQLFDRFSRTLCVEPDQNVSCLLPSNRIGSNFTMTAAFLMTEKSAYQFGHSAQQLGGLVFVKKPTTARCLPQTQTKEVIPDSTSEERYFKYLLDENLIDRCYLPPLSADLERRVVASAVKYVTESSSDHVENVMESAHQEFVNNYYASTKKAILNYLLMRKTSRERLGILQGVPVHALLPIKWKWGNSNEPNGCIMDLKMLASRMYGRVTHKRMKRKNVPNLHSKRARLEGVQSKAVHRKRVQSKLISLLVLSNPQLRALRFMWHDLLTAICLVDLPGVKDFADGIQPMDIIEFERTQLAVSAKMKTFVMENWYIKTKVMFETAIRAETFSIHTSEAAVNFRLRHLFDTVAAVMSLQIRSLIMKSIRAYVRFFELFGEIDEANQENDTNTQFDEPLILPNSSSPFLWNVASQEDAIVVATIRIRAIIEQSLSHLRKLQADYDVFALTHRYVTSVDCFHLEENGELESYRVEMERVQSTALRLAIDNRHSQHLGLFSVDCRNVNTTLHTELAQWTIRLLQAFELRTGRINAELRQQYKEIAARLAKKPLDLYELVDAEGFVQALKSTKLLELQEKGDIIKQRLRFLLFERENMHVGNVAIDAPTNVPTVEQVDKNEALFARLTGFRLSVELLSSTAKTVKWKNHIEKLLKEAEGLLVNERARIEAMFIAKRSRFQAEIDEFEGEVRGFAKKGDLRHAATYVVQLAKMKDNMFIFRQAMETIVKEERKLQWKPTDFSKLDDIAEEMAPYEQLWKTVREFREMNSRWLRGNVFELPGKEGLQTLQQMLAVVAKVSSVLLLNSAAAAITAETVRKQMTDFQENVRLIVAIQNPAIKERHMKAISALIGLDFTSDEAISLLKLLENGAFKLVNDIDDISSNATQEQQIERALNEVKNEWVGTGINLLQAKYLFCLKAALSPTMPSEDFDSAAWNVVLDKTSAEHIVSLMEDHLLRLQTLSSMSHAGPFIETIALWQAFLTDIGQVVEMLTLIEQLWRRLTPLFAASIVDGDSKEFQLFVDAAQLYRKAHVTILHEPACMAYFPRTTIGGPVITIHSPATELISDLNQCREILEGVRCGVRVGFEAKRSSFARFYFLSDTELVTALALARVPNDAKLWNTLSRCFPGISGVQINATNDITALLSSAGEPFPLGSPIVTSNTPIPTWLAKIESSMSTILHASIRAACSDLPRKEFRKWCLIWPEQSLVAAILYMWTLESEQAFQDINHRKAWTELTINLCQNLDAVSREIKVAAYPHAKAALANIILLLNQLRDVSNEVTEEMGGMWEEESFKAPREMRRKSQQVVLPRYSPSLAWIAQPRFYFIDNVLSVAVMTSSYIPYGLEYLGNGSTGILITPLTLRCYHSIAQVASTMSKGVCLEGAAGTGKSTICHQFSRLCGRLYVIFQCANRNLSFDDFVNFVKATASTGAWLCMDNMQLLDATSLSMVTLLCSEVMTCLAARNAYCTLVGDRIRLRRGALFLVSLTVPHNINPSLQYASHDKAFLREGQFFFRTVVVQSPALEKLAEFEFQCNRFVHASTLAKFVTVALTAFQRGFELINTTSSTVNDIKVLAARLVTLRQVKNIVRRATDLNNVEKEHRRRTRTSILITGDQEENEGDSSTGETQLNDTTAEAIAKRDEERMEYRNVSLALRENLGCVVPSVSLHLIDSIIRDFNAQALGRDLHVSKTVMRMSRGSSMLSSSRLKALPPQKSLEDNVKNYVRTSESSWKRFGVDFGLKVVQLLQVLRNHRAVVISGETRTGKTSLYVSLSRALTQVSIRKDADKSRNMSGLNFAIGDTDTALIAPTRYVMVCPRALRCGQLIDLAGNHSSQSVFHKLLTDAKMYFKADKRTQTWLIFDGELDALWSEQLLYTVRELQDEVPGYIKGFQLPSGTFLVVPEYIRVIMETTTLTNASPSFITRLGVVHVNRGSRGIDRTRWENVYGIWKSITKAEYKGYAERIFTVLDTLLDETVSATLAFVAANFQNSGNDHLILERVQWMLALFDSALKQSWNKFVALTSDKQRSTAVHCLFLQALVWGVGSTTSTFERQKFHVFLFDLVLRGPNNEQSSLKRLLTLFFPSGTLLGSISGIAGGEKITSVSSGGSTSRKQTIYDFGFSVEFGSKWLLWTEYYKRWAQILGSAPSETDSWFSSMLTAENSFCPRSNHLVVATSTSSAAISLSGQLLLSNYPTVLCGPRDCGKSTCASTWLLLSSALSRALTTAGSPAPKLQQNLTDTSTQTINEEPIRSEKIYAGFYTKASDVLRNFETGLQRIRIERQEKSKQSSHISRALNSSNTLGSSLDITAEVMPQETKRTVYVFVDDVQCFDTQRRMDSAPELLRMLVESQMIVDPYTNLLTPCQNFLPFATLKVTKSTLCNASDSADLSRLLLHFVPITLPPLSDFDLWSICESISSMCLAPCNAQETYAGPLSSQKPGTPSSTSGSGLAASKDSDQLQAIILKASLKLFRLLTASNDFSILQRDVAFNPVKLHYNFRVTQLFQIIKSIFCDIRPPLNTCDKPMLARLWCHESLRELGDGIMEPKESFTFHRRVLDTALSSFGVADEAFYPSHMEDTAFKNQNLTQNWLANDLHFSFIGETTNGGAYHNGYHEVNEISKVELFIEKNMLAMHRTEPINSSNSESLEIILCSYIIKHVLRISRLLRMDRKAVLLLGARGRKLVTITRLACFICKKSSTVYHIPSHLTMSADQHEKNADASRWNAAFRAALLRTVRLRDAPLVFIVDSTDLDPAAYPYRILDKFLAGHSLTSEVITYDDLDEEVISYLRESAQLEKEFVRTARADRGPSVTAQQQATTFLRSKSAIIEYLFHYVRQKLQIVLILAPPICCSAKNDSLNRTSWAEIFWRFPNILRCCTVNYVGAWSNEGLKAVANKCFAQSLTTADNKSILQISEAAVLLYEATNQFLTTSRNNQHTSNVEDTNGGQIVADEKTEKNGSSKALIATSLWSNCVPSFVAVDQSMFIDHISLFSSTYNQLECVVSSNLARYKAGLSFIDLTTQILQTEQTQAELLLPEARHKTELRRRMSGTLEKEKITADKLTRGLELATTLVATQRERLFTVSQDFQNLIKDSRGIFEQIKNSLREFHEAFQTEADDSDDIKFDGEHEQNEYNEADPGNDKNDTSEETINDGSLSESAMKDDQVTIARRRLRRQVQKFSSLERIPSSIYQLSECLGVILNIEPVEGHDEMDPDEIIMNYWKNIALELTTATFWERLMTFDVPTEITDSMLSRLLPICRSPDFDKDLFASVHEVAGVLCEWVQKCTAFARDFILAQPKYAQLVREQELLKQAEAQVVKSKMEIYDQTASSQHTNALRDLSELERQRADERLQDTTTLLQLTNAAWKGLSLTRDKWMRMHEFYAEFATYWKGDLLLATATVAYASCCTRVARLRLHSLWKEAVASCLVHSSSIRRPLHEVFMVREAELVQMNLNGLPSNDDSALENAVLALHSFRMPLLIDPYGIASDWLKRHLSPNKPKVVTASNVTTDTAVWKEVETSIKLEQVLILTGICKERVNALHSFIGAKRRALFNAINHDISTSSRNDGGYRCWCYLPRDDPEKKKIDEPIHDSARMKINSPSLELPIFEFGSNACRVYFVYSDTNTVPSWLSGYLSQLTVIQFEMTEPFVEAQALQRLLESQGRLREITEIRTLQHDMMICDEQIHGLEEELLDFFSTEKAEQVYSETTKALRIVANRSSVHTLENSKMEAEAKVQVHWRNLERYSAVAKRCVDAVWAWREFNLVIRESNEDVESVLSLSWIWHLMVRAGETSSKNLEDVMACFTSYLQQCVLMNLQDEDRLLFKFLLAFRIWQRRIEEEIGIAKGGDLSVLLECSRRITDIEMLARLLALVSCKNDRSAYETCRPSLKSLLSRRPAGMKAASWSAVCYLAEASGDLRQFISRMESLEGGSDSWKALLELGSCSSNDWNTPEPLDAFTRLCVVTAVHPHRFLCEMEDFAGHELQRMRTGSEALKHSSLITTEGNSPSLTTVVAAATHSAMAQAPDRYRDLFYLWQSFSSSKAPIVVTCPSTIDFVDAVAKVARRAGATMDTADTVRLMLSDDISFKTTLLQAMEKGQWVVLPSLHTCNERITLIDSIYESLDEGQAHSDFRLWISIASENDMELTNADYASLSRRATTRAWGAGFLSLKRSLHHSFSMLKHELDAYLFASTIALHPSMHSTSNTVLSEYEEKCIKQLGVFHALVTSRDHFVFAQWKSDREFGDTELCAATQSLLTLKTDEETVVKEFQSPLSTSDQGMWSELTLRGVISSVYTSTLRSQQDQWLIESCIDLVLRGWPSMENDPIGQIAQITIPEASFVIEKLASIPWASVVSSIPHFWLSESCGLPISIGSKGSYFESISFWDPHNVRRDRQKKLIMELGVFVTSRRCQIPQRLLPLKSCSKINVSSLLELMATLQRNLDGVVLTCQVGEFEYRKPIVALIRHEQQALEQIRMAILSDIRRLEMVRHLFYSKIF
ncbi:unnamed protein product [Phytophthora lilii]|uniref:Unnamed protein product n=1 Tax=Phytophthora lilii TaxID=2077276 RepID=A0A9W6TDF8_9STRA|nr:unnamed protein product [Phytophthora lilii]